MESSPLVSIIVNNFKGTDKLRVCLSSIKESDYPSFEIIVSDCVTAAIDDWVEANFPEVKLTHFDNDIGPAASRNAGYSISDPASKYIVFVDNDTKTNNQWLRNLVDSLEKTPETGAAQPMLLKMNNPEKVDSVGGFFDYIGYACTPIFPSEPKNYNSEGQFDICYCEGVTILRRSVLNQFSNPTQPYDPEYFQHWEDVDMCWKVMLLGYKVILIPDSTVFHERGVSAGLGKQTANLVFLNTRNRLTTVLKNYEIGNLFRYVPVLILFELLKTTILLRNNGTHALATFKGLLWNFINLRGIWTKRVEIQLNVRKVEDSSFKKVLARPSLTRLFGDFQRHYFLISSSNEISNDRVP
jgi:GT2 family glycosyltransferase